MLMPTEEELKEINNKKQLFFESATDEQKALILIEHIVSDDFCEDLEMKAFHKTLSEDEKIIVEKFGLIYRYAHSILKYHSCYNVHDTWRKELEEHWNHYKEKELK